MDAVLLHRSFSSHTQTHIMLDLSLGSPRTMGNRFVHGRRFALCFVLGNCDDDEDLCMRMCELLSRRNRAVAVYYVFIYVFHPLIDTLRLRLRRTHVHYIQHCCQHLCRYSIAFYQTPSTCFKNEPTYPFRIFTLYNAVQKQRGGDNGAILPHFFPF